VQSFCHTLADIIACVAGTLFLEGFDFERVKWLGVRKRGSCKEKNTVKKKGGPALTLQPFQNLKKMKCRHKICIKVGPKTCMEESQSN
jgi:hypothetical protein